MQKIVIKVICTLDEVVQDPAIGRDLKLVGIFLGVRRGNGMGIWTDATDSLGNLLGIKGIPALQENLKPPKHFAHTAGINYLVIFNSGFYIEMAFYSSNRAEINFHQHLSIWNLYGAHLTAAFLTANGYHRYNQVSKSRQFRRQDKYRKMKAPALRLEFFRPFATASR
jgi:hypothetical protein